MEKIAVVESAFEKVKVFADYTNSKRKREIVRILDPNGTSGAPVVRDGVLFRSGEQNDREYWASFVHACVDIHAGTPEFTAHHEKCFKMLLEECRHDEELIKERILSNPNRWRIDNQSNIEHWLAGFIMVTESVGKYIPMNYGWNQWLLEGAEWNEPDWRKSPTSISVYNMLYEDGWSMDDDKLAKAREIINWALGCDVFFPEENIPCRTMRIKTILESDAFVSDSMVDMLSFLPVAYANRITE